MLRRVITQLSVKRESYNDCEIQKSGKLYDNKKTTSEGCKINLSSPAAKSEIKQEAQ